MRALILAAGFGTRLLPYTAFRPKPLFTLNGVPVLQLCIEQLIEAGCTSIIINTHHLHGQIEQFVEDCKATKRFNIPIFTIHEPMILDTGGAIRNVRSFMNDESFFVINSDIVSDIPLKKLWNFHLTGYNLTKRFSAAKWCATLALHDYPVYNKVGINNNLFIKSFSGIPKLSTNSSSAKCDKILAFTGVQVISPEIFDYIFNCGEEFKTQPFSIINLYSYLANKGNLIKAFICNDIFWQDIGTPETYRDVAIKFFATDKLMFEDSIKINELIDTAKNEIIDARGFEPLPDFKKQFESKTNSGLYKKFNCIKKIVVEKLAGDGSDRGWFRCKIADKPYVSVIIADHGIQQQEYGDIADFQDVEYDGNQLANIANSELVNELLEENLFAPTTNYQTINNIKTTNKFKHQAQEIDSFINIGRHLFSQGVQVPQIKGYDRFAGIVVVEDLGDIHLQDIVNQITCNADLSRLTSSSDIQHVDKKSILIEYYKKICALAIDFSIKGIDGFDDSWTFQTPTYSKEMIIEKECRYFVEEFLQGYLKLDVKFDYFIDEFEFIADNALKGAFEGLMHRDMQSRNIMVTEGQNFFFIDFQSARRGPFQYDLASLLIDPYVNLEDDVREAILQDCENKISENKINENKIKRIVKDYSNLNSNHTNYEYNSEEFIRCYRYCSLTRNMQMLGAFSNLSINKGKTFFQQYIPVAVENLKKNVNFVDTDKISHLYRCILDI